MILLVPPAGAAKAKLKLTECYALDLDAKGLQSPVALLRWSLPLEPTPVPCNPGVSMNVDSLWPSLGRSMQFKILESKSCQPAGNSGSSITSCFSRHLHAFDLFSGCFKHLSDPCDACPPDASQRSGLAWQSTNLWHASYLICCCMVHQACSAQWNVQSALRPWLCSLENISLAAHSGSMHLPGMLAAAIPSSCQDCSDFQATPVKTVACMV